MSRTSMDQRRPPVSQQRPRPSTLFRQNVDDDPIVPPRVDVGGGEGEESPDDTSFFDQYLSGGPDEDVPVPVLEESPSGLPRDARKRSKARRQQQGPPAKRQRRLEIARQELKAAKAQIAKINRDVSAQGLAGPSVAQTTELEELNATVSRLRNEVETLESGLRRAQEDKAAQVQERANLEAQVASLAPTIEQLRKEKAELEAQQSQEAALQEQNEIKLKAQSASLDVAAETAEALRRDLEEKDRQIELFRLDAPISTESVTPKVIEDLNAQIQSESRMREAAVARVQELEALIKRGVAANRTLAMKVQELEANYEASRGSNLRLLEELKQNRTKFKREADEHAAQIADTKVKLATTKADLETAQANALASNNAFKDGQVKLELAQTSIAELSRRLNSLNREAKSEIDRLKANQSLNVGSSTDGARIKELEAEVRERDRLLEAERDKVEKVKEDQQVMRQRLLSNDLFTSAQAFLDTTQRELEAAQERYTAAKKQQTLVESELTSQKQLLDNAVAELETTRAELEAQLSATETLRKTNEVYLQKEQGLREEIAGLKAYQENLVKLADNKTASSLKAAQETHAALQSKLNEEQEQSKAHLATVKAEADALRKARDTVAKQATEYSSALEQTKARAAELSEDLEGYQNEFNRVNNKLKKSETDIAKVVERLENLEEGLLLDDEETLDFSKRRPTPWQSGIDQSQFGVVPPTTWKRNPVSSNFAKRVELVDVNNYTPKIPEQASAWRRKMRDVKIAMKIGDPHQVFRDVKALLEQYHHGQLVFYNNFYTMVGFVEGFCGVPNGTFWDATTRGLDHLVKSVVEAASVELTVFPISEAAVFPLSKDDLTAAIAEELRIYRKPPSDSDSVDAVAPPVGTLPTPRQYKPRTYRKAVEDANTTDQANYTNNFNAASEEGRFARLNIERYAKKYPAAPIVGLTQRLLESKVDERLNTKLRLFDASDALLHNYNFLPFLQEKIIKPLNKDQDVYVVEFTTTDHVWTTVFAGHNLNDIAQYLTDHLWQNLQIRQVKGEWVRKPTELSVRNLINTTATNRVLDQIRDIESTPSVPWQVKIQGFLQAAVNATVFSAFMLALTKVGVAFNPESQRVNDLLRDVRFADVVGAIYQSRKKSNTPGTSAIAIQQSHQTVSNLIDVLKQAAGIPLDDTPVLSTRMSTSTFSRPSVTTTLGADRAPPSSIDDFNIIQNIFG